ncbi:unknown, partial [Alces alces papillomavirus 1]
VHPLTLETTETASKDSGATPGSVEAREGPTQPTEPCLTLLLDNPPFVAPSELAKTGVGPFTARLPTAHHHPRGVPWAPIPPPRARARYRWFCYQDHQIQRRRRRTLQT